MTMYQNKKVSLLICYYERPFFIDLIVNNICEQTFIKKNPSNMEVVIVDDSIDSLKLDIDYFVKEIHSRLPELSVQYHPLNEKLTIGEKRNMLCTKAKNPILIFMDDDDYYFPSYIEYSVHELIKKKKSLVGSNCMLFCFVNENFKKSCINCISPRQIHEATMCFYKSHFERVGGFVSKGFGEGARMIDGHEEKVYARMDISKIMVCICHKKNTCNKDMFSSMSQPAQYTLPDNVVSIINSIIKDPRYLQRKRICFKYATRERPEQFKSTLMRYVDYLSGKHEYQFVLSFDEDDTTMNNDDIKSFVDQLRKRFSIEYSYEKSDNKIHAINRNMLAPCFDVLILISDDMIPQERSFDDIIINDFAQYFPDYDGMLNYNDGFRPDWPKLCTFTVYGYTYYRRFNYIYFPEYVTAYCDNEQTEVGRLLNKIKDIDRVIVRHEWARNDFQDDLRKRTESTLLYEKDRSLYEQRLKKQFNLFSNSDTSSSINSFNEEVPEALSKFQRNKRSEPFLLSILIPTIASRSDTFQKLNARLENLIKDKSYFSRIEILSIFDNRSMELGRKRTMLLSYAQGEFITFLDDDDNITDDYFDVIIPCIEQFDKIDKEIDVICFKQECSINGSLPFIVDTDMQNTNDIIPLEPPFQPEYKRRAWHWNIFRKERCVSVPFLNITGPEDFFWLQNVYPLLRKQIKIDKVLHKYTYNNNTTEAQDYNRINNDDKEEITTTVILPFSLKNVFVTGCDENYYTSCLTLLSSIYEKAHDDIDIIVIYDLGLTTEHSKELSKLNKVEVVSFSYIKEQCKSYYPTFLDVRQFAWKVWLLNDVQRFGDLILYTDSGVVVRESLKPFYERLKDVGSLFILDPGHCNIEWTHEMCCNIIKATNEEMENRQLLAKIQGYNKHNIPMLRFHKEALELAKIRECIQGFHYYPYGPRTKGHRHDQSIYSILIQRYKIPTMLKDDVLFYDDYDACRVPFFVHHNTYFNTSNLIFA